jgi:hypothetical protein
MKNQALRIGILAWLVASHLSCGGGGGGGGGGGAAFGSAAVGASPASAGGSPALTTDAAPSGNGLGGIAADDGSSSTSTAASGGDDGSGVGSGGTGVSTADATGIGAVDGAGSIIVNGLRYETGSAVGHIEDAAGLQLGMSAKVTGPVNADFTSGIARRVDSAADIRGPLLSVDLAQGRFVVLGTTVTTDEATVWADATGLAALRLGQTLQIWGLPAAPGVLRATRVEQRDPAAFILTGTVQNLDAIARSFTLGGLVVDYGSAVLSGSLDGRPLSDGTIVRVRADSASPGRLAATLVQWWYPVPTAEGATVQLAGVITDFAGTGALRVLGLRVDASSARITGGPSGAVGNGVKVEVGGKLSGGVLKATQLKIRHIPGTGGPASFDLIGTVGAFRSASDFKVRGQPVNAGGPGVLFTNGTAANLGNGVKVHVHGEQVADGVLTATSVNFE